MRACGRFPRPPYAASQTACLCSCTLLRHSRTVSNTPIPRPPNPRPPTPLTRPPTRAASSCWPAACWPPPTPPSRPACGPRATASARCSRRTRRSPPKCGASCRPPSWASWVGGGAGEGAERAGSALELGGWDWEGRGNGGAACRPHYKLYIRHTAGGVYAKGAARVAAPSHTHSCPAAPTPSSRRWPVGGAGRPAARRRAPVNVGGPPGQRKLARAWGRGGAA